MLRHYHSDKQKGRLGRNIRPLLITEKEITESGMMNLVSAIFQVACSDYTVAYYNTHFDFQEYRDQRALYENENFILNSELMSLLFSDDERYNILVKLRQRVINDHAIYRYCSNGYWKVMPEGMRARYA